MVLLNVSWKKIRALWLGPVAALLSAGCLSSGAALQSKDSIDTTAGSSSVTAGEAAAPEPESSAAIADSAKAARVIFKAHNPSGSFEDSGTDEAHAAKRLFNADGSLLAEDEEDDGWPAWLDSVTVGITDSCAKFSSPTEATATCDIDRDGGGTPEVPCGAPQSVYRVSEVDCVTDPSVSNGNGSQSDPVSIRINLDRDNLASGENLLITLAYAASALNPAPKDPTQCMSGGVFDPTNPQCSDMSYQIFLKHSASETVQPFLTVVPPAFSYVRTDANMLSNGTGVTTKQFYLPIAADSDLSIIQLSRIRGLSSQPEFDGSNGSCTSSGTPTQGSAYCVGMVFYSMTIFRI